MDRRMGIYVIECNYQITLIDKICRSFPPNNLAEDAIRFSYLSTSWLLIHHCEHYSNLRFMRPNDPDYARKSWEVLETNLYKSRLSMPLSISLLPIRNHSD